MHSGYIAALGCVCAAIAQAAPAQTTAAVEYHHAGWNHYFVTAAPDEIAGLDAGAYGGVFLRTGQTFRVWTQPAPGVEPTCRFFTTTFAPRSSHFYTPFAAECEHVKTNPDWQFELVAFYLRLADAGGACPVGAANLYRLYNDGMSGAPNHRYTTSLALFAEMQAQGWTPEGSPTTGVFACVEASGSAKGAWAGTTSDGQSARAFILDDGTYYILSTQYGAETGVLQGTATSTGGNFSSADGRDFGIVIGAAGPKPAVAVTLSGTYVAGSTLHLTVAPSGRTLALNYDASANVPASLAAAVGTYVGVSGHATGSIAYTLTLTGDGGMAGSSAPCTSFGQVTPEPSLSVFRWSLTGTSGGCLTGTTTVPGLMHFDAPTQRIRGFAPFSDRSDMYYVIVDRQ